MTENIFEKLNAINVNDHTEGKNGLTYLSWAWAWAEFKKVYPEATYEVVKFDGLPYVYDENTGYMCYTKVTVGDLTHEMWLPVMDSNNKAMKDKPYKVKTKYKEFEVAPATMFDINKTIMRCLTKNLAMFGLGLYIYAGEDLPEDLSGQDVNPKKQANTANEPEYPKVICPVCGIQILKTTTPKGRIWTPKEILEKYGMCGDCYKKSKLTVDND